MRIVAHASATPRRWADYACLDRIAGESTPASPRGLRLCYKMREHVPSYSPKSGRCKVILQRPLGLPVSTMPVPAAASAENADAEGRSVINRWPVIGRRRCVIAGRRWVISGPDGHHGTAAQRRNRRHQHKRSKRFHDHSFHVDCRPRCAKEIRGKSNNV